MRSFFFCSRQSELKPNNTNGMNKIATISPNKFSPSEPYVCLSIISQNGKYGIVDGNGLVICPCICENIRFAMPMCLARITYKGVEFLLDRHSDYGTFLFLWEEWGIVHNIDIPSLLTIVSWEIHLDHNRELGCMLSEDNMKTIYNEFVSIMQERNNIITREDVLKMTDNHKVREYIDNLASLNTRLDICRVSR